jgi:hypothetical protein
MNEYIYIYIIWYVFQAFMQAVWQVAGCAFFIRHIRLLVQYSLPEDEHKMVEMCRRQEELN